MIPVSLPAYFPDPIAGSFVAMPMPYLRKGDTEVGVMRIEELSGANLRHCTSAHRITKDDAVAFRQWWVSADGANLGAASFLPTWLRGYDATKDLEYSADAEWDGTGADVSRGEVRAVWEDSPTYTADLSSESKIVIHMRYVASTLFEHAELQGLDP